MFTRRHDPIAQSTDVLVQVAGLLLFTSAAVVLVQELVMAPHPTPFELIRRVGGAAVFVFADVYLAVGLVSGRPLAGRTARLDAQLTIAWTVLFLAIDAAVLAVAVALGHWPALAGSLAVLALLPLGMRRAVARIVTVRDPVHLHR
jgi:hypothetical protein